MTSERKFHPSMLWHEHHNPLAECLFKFRPPTRCGSYPFMNIAEDFGLPYGLVLRYSQMVYGEREHSLNEQDKKFIIDKLNLYKRGELQQRVSDANRSQR